MRKILAVTALALSLGACATEPTASIDEVQKLTTKICAFVPTAKTIADILAAGNSSVNKATAIASAICAAVTTNPQSEGSVPGRYVPVVNGVKIEGYKIRK